MSQLQATKKLCGVFVQFTNVYVDTIASRGYIQSGNNFVNEKPFSKFQNPRTKETERKIMPEIEYKIRTTRKPYAK